MRTWSAAVVARPVAQQEAPAPSSAALASAFPATYALAPALASAPPPASPRSPPASSPLRLSRPIRFHPNVTMRMSDCLSGKSTRGMLGDRFVGEGAFRSQELDGREMTLGFRQIRAILRPALCVLYELDDGR